MILPDARQALADALNTVEGVKGYTKRPSVFKTGDAWPILPSLGLEHSLVWRPSWRVLVVLPSDEGKAIEWVDNHFEDIALALREPGFPENAELRVLETEGGDVFVLDITLKTDP